ncbi:Na+/H+ antiporter NhaC family protein [uncultured Selenomonas sp.]|uniref:Na+/H+ antiporter NhaC family protein n=1 Tax=uncultured Selenomonas sp. TaxID=159275 RepID=UPI0025D6C6E9|nr:Na+/H+ antiporter NhaC family protein [uncultured Selenomonas sp.]
MAQTVWSILPPVITIVLALWTKEVYMSLIIGIFSGALLFTGGNLLESILTMFAVMEDKVGGNVNILVFLVILGILVAAITRSGATRAYGAWAAQAIHIDDYFNCLTVGTVMRPVTDKFKIARTKLAYIIDATAAPVCIIAPVSSWAAAVGSSLPEDATIDGFTLFLQTIPFNLYAWCTLVFMIFIIWTGRDYATMGRSVQENAEHFFIPPEYQDADEEEEESEKVLGAGNGKILDLLLPLVVLIAACVYGMLYTGGIHDGKSVADAFANCDSAKSLVMGSFTAFVFTGLLYLPRRVITFGQFCACFTKGFKAMVPAIFILCLAWTLSGICSDKYLDLGGYVGAIVSANASIMTLLPPIFFLVAIGLAFATGTSWGTFGILIPIALAVVGTDNASLLTLCVAATLSGAVGGDHASPISDTTILASAGAQCHHLDHVSTQLPYVLTVAVCCLVGYIVDGLTQNGWLGLATAFGCLVVVMLGIRAKVPVVDK